MSDDDIERLCAGYRAKVSDPPYDAIDAVVLRAAAQRARTLPVRRLAYAVAASLLAALAVAAGLRVVKGWPRPSNIDTRTAAESGRIEARPTVGDPDRERPALKEAQAFNRRTTPFDSYLSNATLSYPRGLLQQRDPEVLLKASAVTQIPSELTCGTAAQIDLNAPGALARLETGRPRDYAKIRAIIAGVTRHPEPDVARWIRTTFHAEDVSYFPLWLTSLPPKRRLSFCLAGSRYGVVLTITHDGARVSPAENRGNPRSPGR